MERHRIKISVDAGGPAVRVYLDGRPLQGVQRIAFEAATGRPRQDRTLVQLTLRAAAVEIDGADVPVLVDRVPREEPRDELGI